MTVLPVTLKGRSNSAYVYAFKTKGEVGDDWYVRYHRIDMLCQAVRIVLEGLFGYGKSLYVGIEGYAFGLRGNAVQTMAEIRQSLLSNVVPLVKPIILPIPTWKSCLCPGLRKSGMKSKEAIMACLHEYWLPTKAFGKDHNKYDSFGMATVLYWAFFRPDISNPSLERFRDREGIRR